MSSRRRGSKRQPCAYGQVEGLLGINGIDFFLSFYSLVNLPMFFTNYQLASLRMDDLLRS